MSIDRRGFLHLLMHQGMDNAIYAAPIVAAAVGPRRIRSGVRSGQKLNHAFEETEKFLSPLSNIKMSRRGFLMRSAWHATKPAFEHGRPIKTNFWGDMWK